MVNIATFNMAGISSPEKRQILYNFFLQNHLDIVCLQEITFNDCPILTQHYDMHTNLGPRKHGTAILVRQNLHIKNVLIEPEGRLISLETQGITYTCIYAPSGEGNKLARDKFFRFTIPAYCATVKTRLVILGDFNAVEEICERQSIKNKESLEKKSHIAALRELVNALDLKDAWKAIRKNEPGWTFNWPSGRARLDRIYATRTIEFFDIYTRSLPFGDHSALVAVIKDGQQLANVLKRTPGLWKLNTAILDEENYVLLINKFFAEIAQHPSRISDVGYWWESIFKNGLKRLTVGYCKNRAHIEKATRKALQKQLDEVVNAPSLNWARYRELKQRILEWERNKLKGFEIRSRIETSIEEEPSIYHVKQARGNGQKSLITQLVTSDNRVVAAESEINQEIIDHFTRIFKNQPTPDNTFKSEFLKGIEGVAVEKNMRQTGPSQQSINRVGNAAASNRTISSSIQTPTTSNNLTLPIGLDELKNALQATKKNKSPGSDGIPFEFYSKFWDVIGQHFIAMIECVLSKGQLLPSQGKAAIRLIPKVPTPKRMTDYRPISLLNTDYKLLASVLSCRLRRTLEKTLCSHQKGGVPGRSIFDSLCAFRDVIGHAGRAQKSSEINKDSVTAAIIAFDLEKAYDLVNRDVLWDTMIAMGYPTKFINWLRTLYSITQLCPLNGNIIVGTIDDAQSVRQGCPLSIHLFAIYIEPLLVKLSENVIGYDLHGESVKVRAYVDDLVVFVSSHADILRACKAIEAFCDWTRARINKSKTQLLGLGKWAFKEKRQGTDGEKRKATGDANPDPNVQTNRGVKRKIDSREITWPVKWVKQVPQLKILGVTFSADLKQCISKNWLDVQRKMEGLLSTNRHRRFTLYGRALFIKQHVIPQAIHVAHILPCCKTRAETIREKLGKFLWSQRREHPSLNVLIRPRNQGGIGAVLPFQFFLSLYSRTLFKSLLLPEGPERAVAAYWLATPLQKHFPHLFRKPSASLSRIPRYIESSISTIADLLDSGLLTPTSIAPHRDIYNHLISTCMQRGRTEIARPELDWPSIWKWVAKIKGREGEVVWDFNHNQLPTKLRQNHLGITEDDLCPICKTEPETDDHLMLDCPARHENRIWLRLQLTKLKCTKPIRDAIHGDIGACPKRRPALELIRAYITTTWTSRTRLCIPTISELRTQWDSLQKLPPNN